MTSLMITIDDLGRVIITEAEDQHELIRSQILEPIFQAEKASS